MEGAGYRFVIEDPARPHKKRDGAFVHRLAALSVIVRKRTKLSLSAAL
jgi:hypothetical protein